MIHDSICPKGQEFLFHPPKPDPNEIFDLETGHDGAETTCLAFAIFSGFKCNPLRGSVVVIGIAMGIAALFGA